MQRNLPACIIFLDFDGVTHPLANKIPSSLAQLDGMGIYRGGPYFRRDNVLQVNRPRERSTRSCDDGSHRLADISLDAEITPKCLVESQPTDVYPVYTQ